MASPPGLSAPAGRKPWLRRFACGTHGYAAAMPRPTDSPRQQWRLSVFGDPYMVWHDGPDFNRLEKAYTKDPELVDRMLVAGVAEQDALAAESIGHLEPESSVPQALAALAAGVVTPSGDYSLRRAETLWALAGDHTHLEAMIAILLGDDHWGVRLDAAIAMAPLQPTSEAIHALQQAVADEEYLVRYHAAESLLSYADREPDIAGHDLFESLRMPPAGEEATATIRQAWADAAAELAADARANLGDDTR